MHNRSSKESARITRNEKKLLDCQLKLQQSHTQCFSMMKEIIQNRFSLINPAVARFIQALRRYYSRSAEFFKPYLEREFAEN